jgi:hypothetical protein
MTESPTPSAPQTTGVESADTVVDSLVALDGLPVSEHVAVFEAAHQSLGQMLAGTPAD